MEIFSLNFIFFIILFLSFLLFIYKLTRTHPQKKLPPGPWKFPLIGSIPHLLGSQPHHHTLRSLAKKYGPIIHLQLGEISMFVISSAQVAKETLKTNDIAMANRPELLVTKIIFYNNADLAFAPYGDWWKQMQKICFSEILCSKKVKSFCTLREEEVSRFIESVKSSNSSPINLGRMIYSLQSTIVCRAVFGRKCNNQEVLINLLTEIVSYFGSFDVSNLFPSFKLLPFLTGVRSKVKKTHQKLDKILDEIIDDHIKNVASSSGDGQEDLVDVLLRLKEKGGLEFPIIFNNIKAITLDMFVGGTETVSTLIEWAMSEMIRNPRIMEKAQVEVREIFKGKKDINEKDLKDCSYLKMVIKETLRLHNPLPLLFPRECREQCEIQGYTIPVKSYISINFSAIARDPEYWNDAENFSPERFENSSIDFKGAHFEFIPFGAGRRMCPGILFGMSNVELVLVHLLYQFDWKLPNGKKPEDLDMSEFFGATARKKNSLSVVAIPYSSP